MGHAEHESTVHNYKTDEFNIIAFDELTSFTEFQYVFMLSRNRSKSEDLPLQIASASNPGDIGHLWVYNRFIAYREPFRVYYDVLDEGQKQVMTRRFIPARVYDNPRLPNMNEYVAGLKAMGPELAAAYLDGNWQVFQGAMFERLPTSIDHKYETLDYYIIRSLDYGWSDDTVVYWLACYPSGNVDIIGELVCNHTHVDSLATLIREKEARLACKPPRISVGSPDMFNTQGTSAKSIGSMLMERGLWFEKANNDRVAGWQLMQTFIHTNRLRVWHGRAPLLANTLLTLQRDDNKVEDVKQKGQQDDAADSLRYGLMATLHNVARFTGNTTDEKEKRNPNKDYNFDRLLNQLTGRSQRVIFPELGPGY